MADQYTFTSARTELLRRLGGRNDTTTQARATEWLNSAQLMFAKSFIELPRLHQVTTQFRTVSDVSEYSLLSAVGQDLADIIGIIAVRNEGKTSEASDEAQMLRMYRFSFSEYRAISRQATGRPVRWARHGTLFALDPMPDDEYILRIDYRRRPEFESVDIDSEWHDMWIDLAASIGWRALGEHQMSKAHMAALPAWLVRQLQTPVQEEEWEVWWDTNSFKGAGGFKPLT